MTPQSVLTHYDAGTLWPEDHLAPADLDAAYQAALQLRALREERGELVVGYKVGFTNRTIWDRYQVFAPIWGPVWNTTLQHCDGEGVMDLKGTCQPRLEPEVVFGFLETPPPQPSLQDVFDCIDWVAAGFEVVQSHCLDWKFTAAQTIMDGALHARLLVGQTVATRELAPGAAELDALLSSARLELSRAGTLVDEGSGANVLDSPLQALKHFIHESQRVPQGATIMPGDVVTTGTWTDAWPVNPGESWTLSMDVGIQPLRVRFL